jgi:hypothetical protein
MCCVRACDDGMAARACLEPRLVLARGGNGRMKSCVWAPAKRRRAHNRQDSCASGQALLRWAACPVQEQQLSAALFYLK